MKSILAGAWPALKPLPVFKYETEDYRASIDFDKLRGEWVCRKISFPSNGVQELRGSLREITRALPHTEEEELSESVGQQDHESEKEAHRRLQAIQEWRENHESGVLYFELRNYLSESQRTEFEESLRLSLTARQLQFNSKNVASVFEAISTAGGRPATLVEFAKRNKAKRGTDTRAQTEKTAPGAERQTQEEALSAAPMPRFPARAAAAYDEGVELGDARGSLSHDKQPLKITSPNPGCIPNNASVREEEAPAFCNHAEDFPAVSIRDVPSEPEQARSPKPVGYPAPQAFEIECPRILDEDSLSPVYDFQETADQPTPFTSFVAQLRGGKDESSAVRISGASSRLRGIELSGLQLAAFALVVLFSVVGFMAGFTALRGQFEKHFWNDQKLTLTVDATAPALADSHGETPSPTSTPLAAKTGSNALGENPPARIEESSPDNLRASLLNTQQANPFTKAKPSKPSSTIARPLVMDSELDHPTPFEEISKESEQDPEPVASVLSTDSISPPEIRSEPPASPETTPQRYDSLPLTALNAPRSASPKATHSLKTTLATSAAPKNLAPRKPTPLSSAAPHASRPSAILVTAPAHGSKPLRVTFPEKAIAASPSFAMTSQLSVLVAPETGPTAAHKPARLQAGELVSYVWPHYPKPKGQHASAETVKVRTTIGPLGQVQDIKLLSGSVSLLPATIRAIRQWRYTPTRLNAKPVQTQEDVTIEFRPTQYSSQVVTRHPSRDERQLDQ
jgi:Gram-negative bacterial TonB protein C-terminal